MDKLEDIERSYDDILYLDYPRVLIRPRQSMNVRASQFSPFAALIGFEGEIFEKERITDSEVFLGEDSLSSLNDKINLIEDKLGDIFVTITYFVKDMKKEGGAFLEHGGFVRRMDRVLGEVVFCDKCHVKIKDIVNIKIKDINSYNNLV